MTQATTPRFRLDNATIIRGQHTVLAQLSLAIADGEKVAIVGPSGAGKSTLLDTLYQQAPADIALCPQDKALVDSLSVFHNIYMGQLEQHHTLYNLWNLVWPLAKPKKEVSAIAADLGIADKLKHSVDRLSGGQRQRVAIGRALYRQCPIFIGDEPVSNLDPVQSHSILSQVLQQHQTALVALHDVDLALDLFDRVIGLKHGCIAFDVSPSSIDRQDLNNLYDQ